MTKLKIDGPPKVAEKLLAEIGPMHSQAVGLCEQAFKVKVTSEDDADGMKTARESRLALRRLRTSSVNRLKEMKSDALAECKAIDQTRRIIEDLFKPAEAHLMDAETYAERKRIEREQARLKERSDAIINAGGAPEDHKNFNDLPDSGFAALIEEIKHEVARKKAEAEENQRRIEEQKQREEADAKRIREENARLKAEAEERDRKAVEERRQQQKKLEAERQARLKAEEENRKAKVAAEAEAVAKEKAERYKLNAPIAERLKMLFIQPDMSGLPVKIQFRINHVVDNFNTEIQKIINDL